VPAPFEDDWMDKFQQTFRNDDFRFVYFGGRGSWTGLHTDVLATFSWSLNLEGRKQWVFWRPETADFDPSQNYRCDANYFSHPEKFPPPDFTIVTGVNEAMFVPSGWFHTVLNIENQVVSINQNWANRANLAELAQLIQLGQADVEAEIQHLKEGMQEENEFEETVQRLLRANLGMNKEDFRNYVELNGDLQDPEVQKMLEGV
jgi:hypothetical protein